MSTPLSYLIADSSSERIAQCSLLLYVHDHLQTSMVKLWHCALCHTRLQPSPHSVVQAHVHKVWFGLSLTVPPLLYKKCLNFWKANNSSQNLVGLTYLTKKKWCLILLISPLLSEASISTQTKWFYFVHVTGAVFAH